MIKQILLIIFIASTMGACAYSPPPPPSCHGTWTAINPEFEFEPVRIIKPLEGANNVSNEDK